jgi:hypothetical protein
VSYGNFTANLHEFNKIVEWRNVYGPASVRMKDEELILRFLTFYYDRDNYKRPFSRFLNDFLQRNKELTEDRSQEFRRVFESTIKEANRLFSPKPFRPESALNTAVFDSVMIGLSERLKSGPISDAHAANEAYQALLADPQYKDAYTRSTADEEKVKQRMQLAIGAFAGVL